MESVTMAKKDVKTKRKDKKVIVARVTPETFKRLRVICKEQDITMDRFLNERHFVPHT